MSMYLCSRCLKASHRSVPLKYANPISSGVRGHVRTLTTATSSAPGLRDGQTSKKAHVGGLGQWGGALGPTRRESRNLQRRQSSGLSGLKGFKGGRRTASNDFDDDPQGLSPPRMILGQRADRPIRTRFAPSPTGYLHLGSLRTALFNNLAARASNGGAFILRIEDTDQSRLVPDAEERILEDMRWAGLSWDEGPDCGGPHAPYRQSERLGTYKDHVQKLIDTNRAYRCFCTTEQLDTVKRELHEAGKPTIYPGTCRSIPSDESSSRAAAGERYVVRFRGDMFGQIKFRDAIYGHFQKKDAEEDFIIQKTDGFPTYHLANVVDDHLMEITHVIRGEEWLISTPKHLALYRAFKWDQPTFAHLGLLVNPDGTKMSKRDASVDISRYRADGVMPVALQAWLAQLGSSFKPKDPRVPRTLDQVAEALTFKFTRGGIKLNLPKLQNLQLKYRNAIIQAPDASLASQEDKVVDEYIVQPTIAEVRRLSSSAASDPEASPQSGTAAVPHSSDADADANAWRKHQQHPGNVVPSLASETGGPSYIREVFAATGSTLLDPISIVHQYPYLFWRVPPPIYARSLATFTPNERILDALHETTTAPGTPARQQEENGGVGDLWTTQGGSDGSSSSSRVMDAVKEAAAAEDVSEAILHSTIRLVATGTVEVPSPNSAKLLHLLGKDEWKHRIEVVKELMRKT